MSFHSVRAETVSLSSGPDSAHAKVAKWPWRQRWCWVVLFAVAMAWVEAAVVFYLRTLFLIPLPWWGPVIAPVSIAMLMILGGTVACRNEALAKELPVDWKARARTAVAGL